MGDTRRQATKAGETLFLGDFALKLVPLVEPGHQVNAGETLIIVESMKMEIAVCAPSGGLVHEVRCAEGRAVQLGQALIIMADEAA